MQAKNLSAFTIWSMAGIMDHCRFRPIFLPRARLEGESHPTIVSEDILWVLLCISNNGMFFGKLVLADFIFLRPEKTLLTISWWSFTLILVPVLA